MKELDFDEVMKDYDGMLDTLTFINIEYNIGNGNYTLDDACKLFPSHSELIRRIYKVEENKLGFKEDINVIS